MRRTFVLGLATAVASVMAEAADNTARTPPAPGVIELPKFVVTDSRELPAPESWRHAEVPGLEVLSTVSDERTRRFVRNFQLLQQVIEIVWPAITQGSAPANAMLVLCGRGNVFDTFVPAQARLSGGIHATSLFLQEQERTAIVIDFVAEKFDDRPAENASSASLPATGDAADPTGEDGSNRLGFMTENDPFREFYLQYFRFTIRRGAGPSPPWLEEGLVQLLASMDFSRKHVTLGRIGVAGGGQRADDFNHQLRRRPLLPLGRMFAGERPALAEAPMYPAQCYAFVHLCLYGKRAKYRSALLQLVARAATGPITEKIFRECFGFGFEEMAAQIRSHASYTAYHYVELRADGKSAGLDEPPPLTVRDATQAEVGRIKGETFRLAGHTERAHTALIAPYIRGERDPRLLAALGLHERSRGQDERARKFLEAATLGRVERPLAYVELSRLRLAETKANAGDAALLTREQTQLILQPLLIAARQSPPLPDTYELMAEVWSASELIPTTRDLQTLYDGAHRFPRRLRLVYLTAALAARHGKAGDAHALIDHGLALARDTEASQHFEALKAQVR